VEMENTTFQALCHGTEVMLWIHSAAMSIQSHKVISLPSVNKQVNNTIKNFHCSSKHNETLLILY